MYKLELVRKRKRRMWAAIIGGIGVTGVATLSIAAFLGHRTGSFTVALEGRNAKLTLSESSTFENSSSYLRVGEVPGFQEISYTHKLKELRNDGALDNEANDYTFGIRTNANGKQFTEFLKYTFFIKNVGVDPARYDFSLQIKEVITTNEGSSLEDSFRVLIFNSDSNSDESTSEVYAKRLQVPRPTEDEANDYRAPVALDEKDAKEYGEPFEGYATMFKSTKEVMSQVAIELEPNEWKKYTIVTWLESFQASGDADALRGASIKLGVEINAYEN